MVMSSLNFEHLRTWFFLRRSSAVFGRKIILKGKSRISLGYKVALADGVEIKSNSPSGNVLIGDYSRLRDRVEVKAKGDTVSIGAYCYIAKDAWIGGYGAINIGTNTMIGIRTIIVSSDHDYINVGVSYFDGSEIPKPIVIGENVWIGSNCVILGGSKIGSGSVVGAGSVVRGVFPENSMVLGVPGVLKKRIKRDKQLPFFE
jgi:acetyltransferase-like isoleucine patch superfamily enzyme